MKIDQQLIDGVSDEILKVADLTEDLTRSDLQGVALVSAATIIKLVADSLAGNRVVNSTDNLREDLRAHLDAGALMKIIQARITEMPKGLFDPMPEVFVALEDGTEHRLFSFFPDEITFEPAEFVGLTLQQAYKLRHQKDVAYLKS